MSRSARIALCVGSVSALSPFKPVNCWHAQACVRPVFCSVLIPSPFRGKVSAGSLFTITRGAGRLCRSGRLGTWRAAVPCFPKHLASCKPLRACACRTGAPLFARIGGRVGRTGVGLRLRGCQSRSAACVYAGGCSGSRARSARRSVSVRSSSSASALASRWAVLKRSRCSCSSCSCASAASQ